LELHHIKNYHFTGSYEEGFTNSTIEEVKSHSITSNFMFADSEKVAHQQLNSHLSKLQVILYKLLKFAGYSCYIKED
jgi:hypothetical protein